jgi:DNA-directed RNA polymerase subunit beta
MTNEGTFLVNGVKRSIISQIVRSPGIYYKTEIDKQRVLYYTAVLISNRGA